MPQRMRQFSLFILKTNSVRMSALMLFKIVLQHLVEITGFNDYQPLTDAIPVLINFMSVDFVVVRCGRTSS